MKIVSILAILLSAQIANAALPPRYQNMMDLDVMIGFVKGHYEISSTLKSIDLENNTIYFGNHCTVSFGRRNRDGQGEQMPEYAEPLEVKRSTCDVY